MKKAMKASSLRSFLVVLIVILIIAVAGGFYLGFQQIRLFAIEVSHTAVDADASGKQIEELQILKQQLEERDKLVAKANKLFATPNNYQSRALSDVQKYAQTYGVTILNTNFEPSAEETIGNTFVITLKSPVNYTKLLNFLDAIEGNLPKMQVTSVSLGHTTSGSGSNVTTEAIKIGISTR
jgi:hypothetical protein